MLYLGDVPAEQRGFKCENRGRRPRFPYKGGEEKSPYSFYFIIALSNVLDASPMNAPRQCDNFPSGVAATQGLLERAQLFDRALEIVKRRLIREKGEVDHFPAFSTELIQVIV
jgi:hypothetical protein